MNENVRTENSVEFQAYKDAVISGIDWVSYLDKQTNMECHIGQVPNFQIYMSESPNLADHDNDLRVYTVSLWSMNVKTTNKVMGDQNVIIARPGFTQLITDAIITAADINEAKLAAVNLILHWNEDRLAAAQAEYDSLNNVFGALPELYSKKIVKAKASESVKHLGLSTAAVSALFANGINVLGQIASMTIDEFKSLKGLGGSRGQEVLFAMKSMGIIMPKSRPEQSKN